MNYVSILFTTIGVFSTLILIACGGSNQRFDLLESSNIPSGSIILTSNSNGTTGPGLISVWTSTGELDRVIYDYSKVTTGFASGVAFVAPSNLFVITDTGGGASNDFLDLFDYNTPFANPVNLFSTLVSGAATTYMRQMALVEDTASNQYRVYVAESGSNRVARLSSQISSNFNFTRDFNFANNGTCVLTLPYGVAHIPSSGNIAVIHNAATGRVNIFDPAGTCVGSTSMTNTPTGAAYHALGDRVIVSYGGDSSIRAHNITTGAQSPVTSLYTSAGQLSTPTAIATDADGYIYVASSGLDLVVKLYWDGVSATASYVSIVVGTSVFTQNITSITVVP